MKTKKGLTRVLAIVGIIVGILAIAYTVEYTKMKKSSKVEISTALNKVKIN
jgi:Tfp pilus assembly protein PilE